MLHFHFCQKYKDKVPSREIDKVVRERVEILRNRDSLRGGKHIFSYGNVYVLQIIKPSPMRVIIQEEILPLEEERTPVFFIQDIVKGNDLETYTEIKNGYWPSYYPILESDKNKFYDELKGGGEDNSQKTQLPENLTDWLLDFRLQIDCDIYETQKWVDFAAGNGNGMRLDDLTAFKILFREMIEVSSDRAKILASNETTEVIAHESSEDLGIVYSRIFVDKKMVYLLHGGAQPERQSERWAEIKDEAINQIDTYTNIDKVSRLAQRAYPSRILKNQDDLWKNIQRISETGNLSLLSEQYNFLSNFKFPAYIDGQAGSGKSTILHYAFSNIYYYKCLDQIKGNIIFLTENKLLLESTKRSIRDILRNNPALELTEEYIVDIDLYFSTLKDFLYAQLEDEEDKEKFPIDRYLDFSKFKELYASSRLSQIIKDKYKPELVWFVITTYIEGYDFNYKITSENYDEKMPRGDKKNITKEELSKIEKDLLPFYEKLINEEKYWNKIKIIKYIQKNNIQYKRHEVIFCDEAQDFSRIELQFIVSLSEYLKYDNSALENSHQGIPIVMAGDPAQTVNPTGFNKADVKDLFYEELKSTLEDNRQYNPEYNYRSSQAIVNLANAVQFFRKKRFKIQANPQKAKRPQSTSEDYLDKFINFNTLLQQSSHYIEQLEHKTIIIPVDSDEKDQYLQSDTFLRKYIEEYSIENNNENKNYDLVRTSSEAKGVDYPQVVIYGFGKYCLDNFGKYDEVENSYQARFFFNKLYVAVTRAQEELIIIDEDDTFNNFWNQLLIDYANSEWQKDSEVSKDDIIESICVINSDNIHFIKRGTSDVELDVAKNEREQALFKNDPILMRLAASRFIKLGKIKEYYLCKAEESILMGRITDAVNFYKRKEVGIEGLEHIANLYWQAGDFNAYRNQITSPKHQNQRLQLLFANWYIDKNIKTESLRELEKHHKDLEKLIRSIENRDKVMDELANISQNTVDREQQILLVDLLKYINSYSNKRIYNAIAYLQYQLNRYQEAIETWDQISDNEYSDLYVKSSIIRAKEMQEYGSVIVWLGELLRKSTEKEKIEKEIIEIYEKYKDQINREQELTHLIVFGAYIINDPLNSLDIAKTTEKEMSNKIKKLVDFYKNLLESNRLSDVAFSFILERWVKKLLLTGNSVAEINESYMTIATSQGKEITPFTKEEIETISSYPEYISPLLPEHIKKITIRNFRRFKDVTIENLGLFNLVVGDNNIGKTSLLESLLFTSDHINYLKRLGFAYAERKNIHPDKEEVNGILKVYYSLDQSILKDFKHQDMQEYPTQFSIEERRHKWNFVLFENEVKKQDISTQYIKFNEWDFKILKNLQFEEALQQPFMPYGKGFGVDLAIIYSNEVAPFIKIEKQFINNLGLFISDIDRIRVDNRKGDIYILIKEREEEIPLHQFGEGANKLFRILLLLTLHKGKRIMIDEIDAGIHYSRFEEFWKIILKAAYQNNTQIISTTHNEECIEYFNKALTELGENYSTQARVLQCKIVAQNLKIRSYDFENFNFAQNKGIEMRGGDSL